MIFKIKNLKNRQDSREWLVKVITALVVGIFLVSCPMEFMDIACYVIAVCFFVYAIVHLTLFITNKDRVFLSLEPFKFICGFILGFISLLLLPSIIRLLPAIAGFLLLINGLEYLIPAFAFDGMVGKKKLYYIIYGIFLMVCGCICMFSATMVTETILKITGVFLIINGVVNFIDAVFVNGKKIKKKAKASSKKPSPQVSNGYGKAGDVVVERVETSKDD